MSSIFLQIQQDVADRLLADPFFAQIPIISRLKKEKLNELQNRINKLKFGGMVFIPQASAKGVRGSFFDNIKVQVGFCENRLTNDTGVEIEEAVEVAFKILNGYQPSFLFAPLIVDQPSWIELTPETEADKNKRLIAVNFTAQASVDYAVAQVATPVITNTAGTVTLSCVTGNAPIYYNLANNEPLSTDGILYTTPFVVTSGALIHARAMRPGYTNSELATLSVP